MKFSEFKNLQETTLYTTQAEKDAILADPTAVAEIVAFNFFGMIGLINATTDSQRKRLTNFFKKDKKLMLHNINDDNHDISLSIKLANDAKMFKTPTDAAKITLFLVKLKAGQINIIDSKIAGEWANYFNTTFYQNLKDPIVHSTMINFMRDGGNTIDVSQIAIALKKRVNKNRHGGQFAWLAKQFPSLKVYDPQANATVVNPVTPASATIVTNHIPAIPPTPQPDPVPLKPSKANDLVALKTAIQETFQGGQYYVSPTDPIGYLHASMKSVFVKGVYAGWEFDQIIKMYPSLSAQDIYDTMIDSIIENKSNRMVADWASEYADALTGTGALIKLALRLCDPSIQPPLSKHNVSTRYAYVRMKDILPPLLPNASPKINITFDANPFLLNKFGFEKASELLTRDFLVHKLIRAVGSNQPDFFVINHLYDGMVSLLSNQIIDIDFLSNCERRCFNTYVTAEINKVISSAYKGLDIKTIMNNFTLYDTSELFQNVLDQHLKENNIDPKSMTLDELLNWDLTQVPAFKKDSRAINRPGTFDVSKYLFFLIRKFGVNVTDKIPDDTTNPALVYHIYETSPKPADYTFNKDQINILLNSSAVTFASMLNHRYCLSKEAQTVIKDLVVEHIKDKKSLNSLGVYAFSGMEKEFKIEIIQAAIDAGSDIIKQFYGVDAYKQNYKSRKVEHLSCLTDLMMDVVDSPVEDAVNDIVEEYPQHVKQKIKNSLVGADYIVSNMEKSDIKFFDKIDAKRLHKIFQYNDMTIGDAIELPRKPKGMKFSAYFKMCKDALDKSSTSAVQPPNVKLNTTIDIKKFNRELIEKNHAGLHGDVYPLIKKIFDYTGPINPEFDAFARLHNSAGKDVDPAFHGTGGIAASMILRYGFKIISSSDPMATGRMLGDGIYLTNKVDKAMQYVSNGGYSRNNGQQGYLLMMGVVLGSNPSDYQSAGTGNDRIRSPEYCVRDPQKQIKINLVLEVELRTKREVMAVLNEDVDQNMRGFKSFIAEQAAPTTNYVTFSFKDGMLPLPDGRVVTIQDAVKNRVIDASQVDYVAGVPTVEFKTQGPSGSYHGTYSYQMTPHEKSILYSLFKKN